jgi:hypothetical protein
MFCQALPRGPDPKTPSLALPRFAGFAGEGIKTPSLAPSPQVTLPGIPPTLR